ncbi:anti-sigma factor domain-containing protein, partial [Alkaliphilus peptidifermentans]
MNYKGCVMEIRNNSMVVMTDHCTFEEIKLRKSIIIGMEIEFSTGDIIQRNRERFKGFVLIAAAILLVVVTSLSLVTYWGNNLQSVALLTIDINPSIAIEINEKQQVIKITPLNEEAGLLLAADLKKLHIKEAFDKIIEMAEDEGYIEKNGENYILITSVKLNNKNKLSFQIDQLVEELIDLQEDKRDDLVMIAKEADIHVLEKANREKISVGKMTLYQEVVKEGSEEGLLDDIKTKSVKELLKKEHPVFDQHPGSKNSNDDAKE